MEISINNDLCIQCGLCTSICPEIFVIQENDEVIANNDLYQKILLNSIKDAQLQCPCEAITIS